MPLIYDTNTSRMDLRLARLRDGQQIAALSDRYIEHGLPIRSWTTRRVQRDLCNVDVTGVVAEVDNHVVGFGIMRVGDAYAHINLLAVAPAYRRCGCGRQLMQWLEETAATAGAAWVFLEVRESNARAQRFYSCLGYREIERVGQYYCGRETAIRMGRDLRAADQLLNYSPVMPSRFR
jgi:ribosomal-protein-alanine acetyltransferase